jgi:mannose-6-phosphate isomerase-like protein (cupin superfamily)
MISVRLRSEDTGGLFGLIEQVVLPEYPSPPLHVHPSFDETFYVVEGTLVMTVGARTYDAGPGVITYVSRGTPHTFANRGDEPARTLVLVTPGGFERYFDELADTIKSSGGMPTAAELAALRIAYGIGAA